MTLWLLDTDHTSLFLIGVPAVQDRILQHSNDVAISIVTVQESFNGWITQSNDPAQSENLADLYTRLWTALNYGASVNLRSAVECSRSEPSLQVQIQSEVHKMGALNLRHF